MAREYDVWSVHVAEDRALVVDEGTKEHAEASAARRNKAAAGHMPGLAFLALPRGKAPDLEMARQVLGERDGAAPPPPADKEERAWKQAMIRKAEKGLRAAREIAGLPPVPPIVCLCGSTRFYDVFQRVNYERTMAGEIVLSVGFYPHAQAGHGHGEGVGEGAAEKAALDELHKRKIDLADYVLVLNVGGYIGESTRGEIEYAEKAGRPVRYLEGGAR